MQNRSVAIQSFDFSPNGWINLFIDMDDIKKPKSWSSKGSYEGGRVEFKNGELNFYHIDLKTFDLNKDWRKFFIEFIKKNFNEIKSKALENDPLKNNINK